MTLCSISQVSIFSQTGEKKIEGNGWGILVYHTVFNKLFTMSVLNHQNPFITGAVPIMIVDVWEHAYYLKYKNRRGDYLEN